MLDTQVNGVAALSSAFLFLTTTTVLLRFLARHRQKAYISTDDYMVVAAWVGFIGLTALSFYGENENGHLRKSEVFRTKTSIGIVHRFIGYHQPKNKAIVNADHPMLERVYLSINALSAWVFGTSKLSALFFYRRIFCPVGSRDAFQYLTIIFIAIVMSWVVVFVVMPFNLCGSHSVDWAVQPGHSAKCKLTYPYFEAATISDFILDVLILILPLPKIWSLKTTTSRKVAISGVFLLALVGLGASTTRMVIIIHLVRNGRAINDEDGYQSNTQTAYYAILEAGLSIVTVNLPSLWYFVNGMTPQRALRSVRGIISIGSARGSQGSRDATKTSVHQCSRDPVTGYSLDTTRSDLNKTGIESYAMKDIEVMPVIGNGIRVEREFTRTEEQV
ncbi:hypothetical protein PT974_00034 [Cladobotryum mycophilum]|uniref:Rhodopsin domain-containing protein n=1 Tax=Cladobotryum mycophilum TaxID=491253 RepID=A0ABR0SZQ7_9HYPO